MYTDAVIKNCFKTKFASIEFIIHSMSWRNAWSNKLQRPKTCCVFSFALVPYLGPLIRCFCTLYENNLLHMTVNNLKYSLHLLLEHAEFKFQTLAITLFIQTEMHIHMHAHTRIMRKSMLVVQRTFFAQMWFSLQNLSIIYFPKLEIFKRSLERKYFVVSKAFVQWLRLNAVLLRVEAHNQTWTMLAKVEK